LAAGEPTPLTDPLAGCTVPSNVQSAQVTETEGVAFDTVTVFDVESAAV